MKFKSYLVLSTLLGALSASHASTFDGCVQTIKINHSRTDLKTYFFDFWEGGNYDSVFIDTGIPDDMGAADAMNTQFPHEVSITERSFITSKLNEIYRLNPELARSLFTQFRRHLWNFVDAETFAKNDRGYTPLKTGDGYYTYPLGYIEDKYMRVTIDAQQYQELDEKSRVGVLFDFAVRSLIKDPTSEKTRAFIAYIFQERFASDTPEVFKARVLLLFPLEKSGYDSR